ncbi:MAG TPA: hypothetical protein VHX20_12395 [Terracidiphilus sp.]|jgi:hypothetical protein|nr:hypothetical protein [Terracidiphilus sp.]
MTNSLRNFFVFRYRAVLAHRWLFIAWAASVIGGEVFAFFFKTASPAATEARFVREHLYPILIAAAVFALGLTAHWYKQKNQHMYGVVEIVFGIFLSVSIAIAVFLGRGSATQWGSLLACAYVIARGCNNVAEAKAKAVAQVVERLSALAEQVAKVSDMIATLRPQDPPNAIVEHD